MSEDLPTWLARLRAERRGDGEIQHLIDVLDLTDARLRALAAWVYASGEDPAAILTDKGLE